MPVADVLLEAGVVRMKFKRVSHHNLEDAKQIVEAHNKLADGRKCPVLANLRGVKVGADKAARNHYVTTEAAKYKSAMAMVTESAFQRTLGALFLYLSRPPYPSKMFKNEVDALQWLETYS